MDPSALEIHGIGQDVFGGFTERVRSEQVGDAAVSLLVDPGVDDGGGGVVLRKVQRLDAGVKGGPKQLGILLWEGKGVTKPAGIGDVELIKVAGILPPRFQQCLE